MNRSEWETDSLNLSTIFRLNTEYNFLIQKASLFYLILLLLLWLKQVNLFDDYSFN